MADAERWIVAMCSRRAGKTNGIAGRFLRNSLLRPRGNRVYLALTGGQARDMMWEPIWKPLLERHHVRAKLNETRMVTTFPNGSRVRMAGTDDIRAIKKELGQGLDEACIDEGQDQPDAILRDLCIRILNNAMMDKRGTLIVSGVVPEVDAGYFMELWKVSEWSKHNWSQMENPHVPHARAELDEYLAKNPGVTIDSPIVQRERFGKFKYDAATTAYAYAPPLNSYKAVRPAWIDALFDGSVPGWLEPAMRAAKLEALPFCHWTKEPVDGAARFGVMVSEPRPGITRFAAALDPGTSDRASLTCIGWGEGTEEVQHVFEFSTPRKNNTRLGELAVWMAVVQHVFQPEAWFWDPGAGRMEIDTMGADYGIDLVRAAPKSDTAGQIRRENDLLVKGLLKVMEDSAAEQDMMRARRDQSAPAAGPWKWDSRWHPDPAESLRYTLGGYFAAYRPPPAPRSPEEVDREKAELANRRRQARKRGRRLEEDEEDRAA